MTMGDSSVLDAFVAATAANDPFRAEALQRELEAPLRHRPEREVLQRVLTAASRATSKALMESPRGTLIQTGDDAYQELNQFKPVHPENAPPELIGRFRELMMNAAEKLGPFRGGELGSFKKPELEAATVEDFAPSETDMVEMAHASGVVVGRAGAAGHVDSLEQLRAVIDGCPVCGAAAHSNGGRSAELDLDSEPQEFGSCEFDHRLARSLAVPGPWHVVKTGELWATGGDPTGQ